jgi:hypothetical protein
MSGPDCTCLWTGFTSTAAIGHCNGARTSLSPGLAHRLVRTARRAGIKGSETAPCDRSRRGDDLEHVFHGNRSAGRGRRHLCFGRTADRLPRERGKLVE